MRCCLVLCLLAALCTACGGGGGGESTGGAPFVPAAPPETWAFTGNLPEGVINCQTAVLDDGRVLAVGGAAEVGVAGSSIFDPTTETWSAGPDPHDVRANGHSLTKLPDGRVLLVGGAAGDALTSAEIFDPSDDSFRLLTAQSSVPRAFHNAILLNGGNVLVVGGHDGTSDRIATDVVERFDPASETFSTVGALASARYGFGLAKLEGGRVLAAGGFDGNPAMASCEIYDPGRRTWSATGDMNLARGGTTPLPAITLGDGRVLVVGENYTGAETYDPTSGTWTTTGAMEEDRRTWCTAVRLQDGQALVIGGRGPTGDITNVAEIFDPAANAFRSIGDTNIARASARAVVLDDGRVLLIGGNSWFLGSLLVEPTSEISEP